MEINQTKLAQRRFHNVNQETVTYHGEPIEWRVSAYGVAIQDNKVLLAKNKFESYYDLPGGGIDLGETPEEAVARESVEESGYLITPGKLLDHETAWFQIRSGEFYQSLRLYFAAATCEKVSAIPTDPEMNEAVWVSWPKIENGTYRVDEVVRRVIKSMLS